MAYDDVSPDPSPANPALINSDTADATTATTSTVTDLTYTYDADGNISKIVNSADKKPAGSFDSVTYTYDGINRLSSVTSTCATESNGCKYTESFTYSKTGNILTDTFAGTVYTYSYTDASHPQTVTSVSSSGGTTSYTYDSNGNQKTKTDSSGATTYSWTHRNELSSVTAGGKTSSFSYDPSGSRFAQSLPNGKAVTTLFPDSRYETVNGTTTVENYLSVNGTLSFASVTPLKNGVQDGSSTAKFFSPDHLGSTNLISNDKSDLTSFEDYYSFGRPRVSVNGASTSQEARQFIGKEYDETLGLSYLEARYYDSSRGSFISADPVSLVLGDENLIKSLVGKKQEELLSNPQFLNAYSYANNNPIILSDPAGLASGMSWNWRNPFDVSAFVPDSAYNWAGSSYNSLAENNPRLAPALNYTTDHPYISGAAIGVATGAGVAGGVYAAGGSITCAAVCSAVTTIGTATTTSCATGGCQKTNDALNNGFSVGDKVKNLGTVIENGAGKISGFNHDGSFHGLDRVIGRNLSPQTLIDTVSNPLMRFQGRFDRIGYLTREAYVVLDKSNQVVTAWSKNEFGNTIKDVLGKIK